MARKLSRRALAMHIATQMSEGAAVAPLARQVAAYLIETGRVSELELILRDATYYLAQKGYVFGTVTTAHALAEATRESLSHYVQKATQATTVELASHIDPSVLAGFKLSLPGKELDATAKHSLMTLKTRYKKA